MPENIHTGDSESVTEIGAAYAHALRVWLPNGTQGDYEEMVRSGGSRGALVLISGLVERVLSDGPLPQEKQHATAVIRRIERLDAATRSAVDEEALSILQQQARGQSIRPHQSRL